jgi:uncharacterized protein YegP (UPF0339 family)
MTFELFKSKKLFYFRIKAKNGRIIAQSEGYKTKRGVTKTVGVFMNAVMDGITPKCVDLTTSK